MGIFREIFKILSAIILVIAVIMTLHYEYFRIKYIGELKDNIEKIPYNNKKMKYNGLVVCFKSSISIYNTDEFCTHDYDQDLLFFEDLHLFSIQYFCKFRSDRVSSIYIHITSPEFVL